MHFVGADPEWPEHGIWSARPHCFDSGEKEAPGTAKRPRKEVVVDIGSDGFFWRPLM